ncbi:hypothetical protein VC83_03321 [Pseudogymnoascus destructans]|uniref:Uncharacterized protein n=1 Tax=Pseudogymnoascus destructans TaxID=655981 RepID=A0A177AH50_9PEZI|nr:uncharacterized protein VC83_03321 [Pseudogymnoascus destructans]OAF60504.1 hypothetical protein VC83_03321 [Pseudogymnoascus destructans]
MPMFECNIAQDNIEEEPGVDTMNEINVAATSVGDRSESRGSNQTESKRGSWSHVRTHSATQQIPDQTVHQLEAADVSIPPNTPVSVQTADLLVAQEISNIHPQTYHQEPRQNQGSNVPQSNDQHLPNHQRHSSQPRVELQTQQHYITQANPASQSSQPQSAQSYQIPNTMTQSAVHEINLQKALEAQTQQHFEALVLPPTLR